MRQTSKQRVGQRAGHPRARQTDPNPIRFIALTMVALVGVGAGAVLGAAAYRFEQPSAPENTQSSPARTQNTEAATTSQPEQKIQAAKPAQPRSVDRQQQVAGVTVVTPTSFSREATDKGGRQQAENILTVASIIQHAEETRPKTLSATSARFGDTAPQPLAGQDPKPSFEPQENGSIDKALTGSIAAPTDGRRAAVGQVELDEMQSRLSKENAEYFKYPADTVAAAAIAKGMRMSQALKYVSLRSEPDKTSTELAVVPAGAQLLAETDCDRWCGAVYEGHDGYIYHTYLQALEQGSGEVEIAETEAEVQAIEARMAAQDKEHFRIPAAPKAAAPAAPSASGLREGWATKYVNLRAGPDNKSKVLTIVPANAPVRAEDNCRHWCRTIYDGQEGYIYKSFIRRQRGSSG